MQIAVFMYKKGRIAFDEPTDLEVRERMMKLWRLSLFLKVEAVISCPLDAAHAMFLRS